MAYQTVEKVLWRGSLNERSWASFVLLSFAAFGNAYPPFGRLVPDPNSIVIVGVVPTRAPWLTETVALKCDIDVRVLDFLVAEGLRCCANSIVHIANLGRN
jgi:hypothetical protein